MLLLLEKVESKKVWQMTKLEYESKCLWHGTDSQPFKKFKQKEATKGQRFWNPLGNAMYVTDKKEFARNFGSNQYPVYIPSSDNITIRKIYKDQKDQVVLSIIKRTLKKVGLIWNTTRYTDKENEVDISDKVEISRAIERYKSAYESIVEAGALIEIFAETEDRSQKYKKITPEMYEEAANHFLGNRYDIVYFQETNDPNNYLIEHKSAKEIIIYNPSYQKITFHKELVEDALKKGKPVPEHVMKDYPDLIK